MNFFLKYSKLIKTLSLKTNMRAYFPLPPSISIEGIQEKIIGSLTFLNCPNNRLRPFFSKNEYRKSVFLGLYSHNKDNWDLLQVEEC